MKIFKQIFILTIETTTGVNPSLIEENLLHYLLSIGYSYDTTKVVLEEQDERPKVSSNH